MANVPSSKAKIAAAASTTRRRPALPAVAKASAALGVRKLFAPNTRMFVTWINVADAPNNPVAASPAAPDTIQGKIIGVVLPTKKLGSAQRANDQFCRQSDAIRPRTSAAGCGRATNQPTQAIAQAPPITPKMAGSA